MKPLSGDASPILYPLLPGPLPVIPTSLWALIEEWITAWEYVEEIVNEGLMRPGPLLLHGPTGSGKTMLASAILKRMEGRAGAVADAHHILEKVFGSSARNIGQVFGEAKELDCLLVIEEIDALGADRKLTSGSCASEENKITIALMREIEACELPVIATTNFRERLDPALLRRFEMQVEVPVLDEGGRALLLKKILKRDAEASLVALPLVESIRIAHRVRRSEFIKSLKP